MGEGGGKGGNLPRAPDSRGPKMKIRYSSQRYKNEIAKLWSQKKLGSGGGVVSTGSPEHNT